MTMSFLKRLVCRTEALASDAERFGLKQVYARDPQTSVADVIFIHGIIGDARKTWTVPQDGGGFWPQWLVQEMPALRIWTIGYPAQITRWAGHAMSVIDRATNVLAEIASTPGIGNRPIIFIAHSMGGLVVKQLLRRCADSSVTRERTILHNLSGIVFFATPHIGSDLAAFAAKVATLARLTTAVKDMEAHSSQLRDLNTWFRDHIGNRTPLLVFAETRPLNGVMVVQPSSADPGVPLIQAIPVDADHVGICKLPNRDDMRFRQVQQFIRDCLQRTPISKPSDSNEAPSLNVSVLQPPPPLWCEDVDPATVRYRIERTDQVIQISPLFGYREAFDRGSVAHLSTDGSFRWAVPQLDVKICNNSGKTAFVERISLRVAESRTIYRPLLTFSRGKDLRTISIFNSGWATVRKCRIQFALFGFTYDAPLPPEIVFDRTVNLPDFDVHAVWNLEQTLAAEGIDVPAVQAATARFRQSPDSQTQLEIVKALGPFGAHCPNVHMVACGVAGEAEYEWEEPNRGVLQHKVRFRTFVEVTDQMCSGIFRPTSSYPVGLQSEGANYVQEQGVSHEVKNGEVDRIILPISAPKSSAHRFVLEVLYNNGRILRSEPIELEVFSSRTGLPLPL